MSVRILQSYRIAVVVILSSLIVLTVARVSMAQRQQAAVETGVNDQLITKFHGTEYLLANGEFAVAGKSFVIATITDAAGDAFHDFVPDGSDVTQTRDIIQRPRPARPARPATVSMNSTVTKGSVIRYRPA